MINPKAVISIEAVVRANRWIDQNPEAKAIKEAVITAIVPTPMRGQGRKALKHAVRFIPPIAL